MSIFRLFTLISLIFLALPARAETAHVTFVLVNDIYEMTEQIQPSTNRCVSAMTYWL